MRIRVYPKAAAEDRYSHIWGFCDVTTFTGKIPIFWPPAPPSPYIKCNALFIVIHIVNFDAFTIFTAEINAFFSKSPLVLPPKHHTIPAEVLPNDTEALS